MPRAQYRKRHGTEAASQRIGGVQTRKSRLTFDRSPVRESRTPGSVRGDRGNPVPYRVIVKLRQVLGMMSHNRRMAA